MPETVYLSSDGNNGNPGTFAQPVATLTAARDRVRASGCRHIVVRGGRYDDVHLDLDQRDAGLVIEAAPGETPILCGGVPLRGWTRVDKSLFAAPVKLEHDFRLLCVNGSFRPRARFPHTGRLRHESVFDVDWLSASEGGWRRPPTREELTTMACSAAVVRDWGELADAEVSVLHQWNDSLVGIDHHDDQAGLVRFRSSAGYPAGAFGVREYIVWNTRPGLFEPGRWMLDRSERRVLYWPLSGEDPNACEILVPTRRSIVQFHGTRKAPVRDIVLRGLTLQVTNTPLVAGGFGASEYAGAVHGLHVHGLRLERTEIRCVGGQAVRVSYAPDGVMENCHLHDTGAGACYWFGHRARIENNRIHDVGRIYLAGMGIYIRGEGVVVRHNHIHDIAYTAINGSSGTGSVHEYNRMERILTELMDGGGIYIIMADNVAMRGNLVRDALGERRHAYYYDELSHDSVAENNVAIDVSTPLLGHMAEKCAYRNNIILNREDMCLHFARCKDFALARNVFVAGGEIVLEAPEGGVRSLPGNIFHARALVESVLDERYDELRRETLVPREGSVAGDPLLSDGSGGVYGFAPDSPAHACDIEPVDVSQAGTREA